MSIEPPSSAAVHPTAPLEVLNRVRAARNGCDLILEGRVFPDVSTLAALISILTKAMQWQAGDPPVDLEEAA